MSNDGELTDIIALTLGDTLDGVLIVVLWTHMVVHIPCLIELFLQYYCTVVLQVATRNTEVVGCTATGGPSQHHTGLPLLELQGIELYVIVEMELTDAVERDIVSCGLHAVWLQVDEHLRISPVDNETEFIVDTR